MLLSDQEKLLHWRCRRGMRELDLMLLPFFESCYKTLSEQQQTDFAKLLEQTDQDLYQWLRGDVLPQESIFVDLVKRIRDFANQQSIS